jgi:hypothetical protein
MERWSTQWAHERITQWQREQPLSAHRHGYDREMLREGIVQVCVKPYRARHRRFTDETLPLVGLCDIDGGVAISWDSAIS